MFKKIMIACLLTLAIFTAALAEESLLMNTSWGALLNGEPVAIDFMQCGFSPCLPGEGVLRHAETGQAFWFNWQVINGFLYINGDAVATVPLALDTLVIDIQGVRLTFQRVR